MCVFHNEPLNCTKQYAIKLTKNLSFAFHFSLQFMITAAVSVAFTIGNVLSWRALALTGKSNLFKYSSNNKGKGRTEKN